MPRLLPFQFALATLFFAACVTVNVYFPAAAAEQAADQIIDTVTGQSGGAPAPDPTPQPPSGSGQGGSGNTGQGASGTSQPSTEPAPDSTSRSAIAPTSTLGFEASALSSIPTRDAYAPIEVLRVAAAGLLNLLVPSANAQANADLDISTPEIRAVTSSMQQRFTQLEKYFASGVVGLTADGLVEVRDQNAIALAERATVKRLVAEDNRDRATLYAEIAKANGHPEWESDIRRTFARRWVERGAKKGWYYQDAKGGWVQK